MLLPVPRCETKRAAGGLTLWCFACGGVAWLMGLAGHPLDVEYRCGECGLLFGRRDYLAEHRRGYRWVRLSAWWCWWWRWEERVVEVYAPVLTR